MEWLWRPVCWILGHWWSDWLMGYQRCWSCGKIRSFDEFLKANKKGRRKWTGRKSTGASGKMIETKFRLIRHGQIVGYERWNSIAGKWCYNTKPDGAFDIRNDFIPHTDKDCYTGLLDKNGKEICEGDVVACFNYDGSPHNIYPHFVGHNKTYNNIGAVENEDGLMFTVSGEPIGYESRAGNSFEVIGNVHDNPELPEKGDK